MANGQRPVVSGAVEGDLDEAVLRRVLDHAGLSIGTVHGRRGKRALLQAINGYNNAARHNPWVALIDLDRDCDCAPPCVRRWLPQPSPLMCFRVAVRAIEAWLLADRERIARWLGIAVARVPQQPDHLDDPKQALISLARLSSRRSIREELVPRPGSGRTVGPLYTTRMIEFVCDVTAGWRPNNALGASDSLARCVAAMRRFVGRSS